MRYVLSLLAMGFILTFVPTPSATAQTDGKEPPAGAYLLDADHASVTFKISHLGFSHYTGRFDKLEGTLNLNPSAIEQSALDVTIYPNSVDTNNVKLEEELRGDKFLDVITYPRATFRSTKIERTSLTTAKVTGDFTLKGQTHSVTLDTVFIGTGIHPFTKKQVVGFSAVGTIHRSDYNLSNLIPMVGDDVSLEIEAEFDRTE